MKVVHLSFSDSGVGAARDAHWLDLALREGEAYSHMFIPLLDRHEPHVHAIVSGMDGRIGEKVRAEADRLLVVSHESGFAKSIGIPTLHNPQLYGLKLVLLTRRRLPLMRSRLRSNWTPECSTQVTKNGVLQCRR